MVFCLHVCLCEDVRYPGTGVTDSCELPCGCWELNPGALEEQPVILATELSLQPLEGYFGKSVLSCHIGSRLSTRAIALAREMISPEDSARGTDESI